MLFSFDDIPLLQTLTDDAIVYRYWDGIDSMQPGRYVTTQLYDNPINALALA